MMIEVPELRLSIWTWSRLMRELRRRGEGRRESGAFLLGKTEGDRVRVSRFVCYDDLDPRSLDKAFISFASHGYPKLWEHCRAAGLDVVADIHTHPGGNTGLSMTDRQHPMLPNPGHYALIVPSFAGGPVWSSRGVSIHRYLGGMDWQSWHGSDPQRPFTLVLW